MIKYLLVVGLDWAALVFLLCLDLREAKDMGGIRRVVGGTFSLGGKKVVASKKMEGLVMEFESSNAMKLLMVLPRCCALWSREEVDECSSSY